MTVLHENNVAPHIQTHAPGYVPAPTLWEIVQRRQDQTQETGVPLGLSFSEEAPVHDADPELAQIYLKAFIGERLTSEEGLLLLTKGELTTMGRLASRARARMHPGRTASFLIDRNINYTNICRIGCDFCAFYRREGAEDGYILDKEVIFQKIQETIDCGGTGILLQGGVNPRLKIEWYEDLFRSIKSRFGIHLHALSTIEIENIAQVSRLTIHETLERLKAAGLDSIPGAGAEILADDVRLVQSPAKRHGRRWLDVMREAHSINLPTTATMMFGALDKPEHIIDHMVRIREVQDQTNGFYAFIMWTFQSENTELAKKHPETKRRVSAVEYLKVVAVSRLMMDNIPNIQGSCVTMGTKVGQMSLHFGANDIGSIMLEENVVRAAGTHHHLERDSMVALIRSAGFEPFQRDTYYNVVRRF